MCSQLLVLFLNENQAVPVDHIFTCHLLCRLRTWIDEQSGISEVPNVDRVDHCPRLSDRGSRC